MNLITKVILLIVMILLPILGLYAYSYQQTIHVIEKQINTRNEEKLANFLGQIEILLDQNMLFAALATKDPEIKSVAFGNLPTSGYDRLNVIQDVQSKLSLFSITNNIMNIISIYFPRSQLFLSTDTTTVFDEDEILKSYTPNWRLNKVGVNGVQMDAFSRFFVSPFHENPADIKNSELIIRVDFFTQNITNLLDSFKLAGHSDAFFYHTKDQVVYSSTANTQRIQQLMQDYPLDQYTSKSKFHDIVSIDGKKYLLYTLASSKVDWSLVDIEPLDEILQPVVHSRNLFYMILLLLLLFGTIAAFLLYFHIQVPIRILIRGVEHIKNKNFAYQIKRKRNNEFQQLFDSFNGMGLEIDQLIKRVYIEEIRSREAAMKQLQSQINPHFLYNCLAYIVNMAKMNKNQSVIAMAHNLGDYYKYTTRNETLVTTLHSEIELAVNYMNIMNQQLDKFQYTCSIPESMKTIQIPKLIFQPIIENAIVHGLEEILENGWITIVGLEDPNSYRLIVEDNGPGLSTEKLQALKRKISMEDNESDQTGLWNVHHRFNYYFGKNSGMLLDHSTLGGLKVELYWKKVERE